MVSKNNIKIVLNLSGYAKEGDLEYLKSNNSIEKKYLVVKNRYFNKTSGTENILSWKSMGMSDEILKPLFANLFTKLEYPYPKMVVKFNGVCFVKGNKFTFDKKVLDIVYELDRNSNTYHPKQKNCLFGSVKVTRKKNDFNFKI